MKTIKICLIFLLAHSLLSAQTVKDVFTSNAITWYGLDVSKLKCVGPVEAWGDPQKLRDTYFRAWNGVILNEPDKYNIRKFFKKDVVKTSLDKVDANNGKADVDSMIVTYGKVSPISESQLVNMAAQYSELSKKGVGLVFIAEVFNKNIESGLIHVVFFDMASGQVLMLKTMEGKPGGFGLRNYWVRSVLTVMEQCERNWNRWSKEAGVKY